MSTLTHVYTVSRQVTDSSQISPLARPPMNMTTVLAYCLTLDCMHSLSSPFISISSTLPLFSAFPARSLAQVLGNVTDKRYNRDGNFL